VHRSQTIIPNGKRYIKEQHQHETRTEVAYNLLDGMNRLAALSSFAKHGLHAYTIPPPLSSSDGLMQAAKKQEADSLDGRRRLQKPSIGTYGQGLAAVVHSTLSLPK